MTSVHLQADPYFNLPPTSEKVPPGLTIAQMLDYIADGVERTDALHVVVRRRGVSHVVPRALWDKVRPKEGTEISVLRTFEVGDGDVLRTIAMIAVMAFATWITGGGAAAWFGSAFAKGTFGAALLGATTGVLGMLAVNAIFPPPSPGGITQGGRWNALTGTNNAFNPGGPIPCPVGSTRFFPPHAARAYSETIGETSYHYYLFDLGHLTANAVVSQFKIGSTDLSAFDEVDYNVTTTPTIFTNDVEEVAVGAALVDGGGWVERTTSVGIDGWSADMHFTRGLFGVGTSGKDFAVNVYFDIEARNDTAGGTWQPLNNFIDLRYSGIYETGNPAEPYKVRFNNKNPFAVSFAHDTFSPAQQFSIRVKRIRTEYGSSNNTHVDDCTWTVLRSITHTNPSTTGTTKVEMRIKATDQLTGPLDTFSCYVEQSVPVYDEGTGLWTDTVTDNTAWVTYWLMTACPALKKLVPASRMDLNAWLDYADFCTLNALGTHSVLDTEITLGRYVDDILRNSLARLSGGITGKYTVLFDDGTKTKEGAFTTLESGNLKWRRSYVQRPHGLKVRFRNPEVDWDWDTLIVLDDGYTYNGLDARGLASADPAATIFEELEMRHAAYAQQAWRVGRLALGQARYQPATTSIDVDHAGIRYTRGNVVEVENDVMDWGCGAGFVREVDGTTVRLSKPIGTTADLSYTARVRRVDTSGNVVLDNYAVTPHSVMSDTFYFDTPPTVAVGDTVIIGETSRETVLLYLTNRQGRADHHFSFDAVAYDSRVAGYWADPPATLTSEITAPPFLEPPDPPTLIGPISDPDGDDTNNGGIGTTVLRVNYVKPSGLIWLDRYVGLDGR